MFETYCKYVLTQSNAPEGRYSKEDLRKHVLRMPHGMLTMVARDLLLEERPILPEDFTWSEWVNTYVMPPAEENKEWAPMPFFIKMAEKEGGLAQWHEFKELDVIYMPMGLEPCIVQMHEIYAYNQGYYVLADMRFLPLKSYEHRKA